MPIYCRGVLTEVPFQGASRDPHLKFKVFFTRPSTISGMGGTRYFKVRCSPVHVTPLLRLSEKRVMRLTVSRCGWLVGRWLAGHVCDFG